MANRITPGGNGSAGKGMVDISDCGPGCTLFTPNPTHPPSEELFHVALTNVMQHWMLDNKVRVRATLPVVYEGNTVAVFIWWDPPVG